MIHCRLQIHCRFLSFQIHLQDGQLSNILSLCSKGLVFPNDSATNLLWPVAVSAFAIGGPFGSFVGGTLANTSGRRGAMLINVWIFFVGRDR